ncbi:ATP-dependent 6-phosphofructokinase [bacterium]|nr:ATP-dependent 6-phosphofructokinase [bacterium]
MAKRVGVLTGGGDCPGLNAVIRAIAIAGAKRYGFRTIGIEKGWKGVLEMLTRPLTPDDVFDIVSLGGTILKTSRTNPYKDKKTAELLRENLRKLNLDALIAIGGDDTLSVAYKLSKEGFNVVGVPKTIDNDVALTDKTFGFDTAVNIATRSLDSLKTTAFSHERTIVVEIMGRHAGWLTLESGIAAGADAVLIPEKPFNLDELCNLLVKKYESGKRHAIIAISEGARLKLENGTSDVVVQDIVKDAFGNVRLGGIGKAVAKAIEEKTGIETRSVVLGHLQRGGTPSAFDRWLGTRYGLKAAELVANGEYGRIAALRGTEVVGVEMTDEILETRTVPPDLAELTELFQPIK